MRQMSNKMRKEVTRGEKNAREKDETRENETR